MIAVVELFEENFFSLNGIPPVRPEKSPCTVAPVRLASLVILSATQRLCRFSRQRHERHFCGYPSHSNASRADMISPLPLCSRSYIRTRQLARMMRRLHLRPRSDRQTLFPPASYPRVVGCRRREGCLKPFESLLRESSASMFRTRGKRACRLMEKWPVLC
jgi:hypothetical protein